MSSCNFTSQILETDCIGDSRVTINNNFATLDTTVCSQQALLASLSAQIATFNTGPTFITPVILTTTPANTQSATISTINVGNYVPSTAKTIILELSGTVAMPDTAIPDVYLVRKDSSSPWLVLAALMCAGSQDWIAVANQGVFPISNVRTIDMMHTYYIAGPNYGNNVSVTIRLIGYF